MQSEIIFGMFLSITLLLVFIACLPNMCNDNPDNKVSPDGYIYKNGVKYKLRPKDYEDQVPFFFD